MTVLSVVLPVYQSADCLDELYRRLAAAAGKINKNYEVIFVEDGGSDGSWQKIQSFCRRDKRIKGVRLSRNFGQHRAIAAGLHLVRGTWTVVMDADLQNEPEVILKLYRKAQEGYDAVIARRTIRHDTLFKKLSSRVFYTFLNLVTDISSDFTVATFGIYNSRIIQEVNAFRETDRFFPVMINWLGFRKAYIDVKHAERYRGSSQYNFFRSFQLAVDITISYSNKPLTLFIYLGFVIALCSFIYGLFIIVKFFLWGIPIEGWPSLIVSIYFMGGLFFVGMGVIGLYIGKIYKEVRQRPLYVIREQINVG